MNVDSYGWLPKSNRDTTNSAKDQVIPLFPIIFFLNLRSIKNMSLPRNLLDESLKKDDMKRTICFPIFSIMLYACSNSIQTDNAKYNITFDDNNFVEVKDKVSDLEVIELELTEEALIPVINSISVHGDKIFCFSCEQNGFIKVFDTKGKFLYDISHHGSANNEWIRLKSMYIDEGDSSIILTDAESKKLLIYSM